VGDGQYAFRRLGGAVEAQAVVMHIDEHAITGVFLLAQGAGDGFGVDFPQRNFSLHYYIIKPHI